MGDWNILQSEELMICTSRQLLFGCHIKRNVIRRICSSYGGQMYRVLFGKPERRSPLRRPRHRSEENI